MRSDIVRNLVIILVGVLLVFMNESTMPLLIRVVGVLFFVPAFISLAGIMFVRQGGGMLSFSVVVNIGSMALGLWLLFSPEVFEDIFFKLLAVVVLAASFYRLYFLYRRRKSLSVSWRMALSPLLMALASIVLFANPFATVSMLAFLLGLCLVFMGFSDIFLLMLLGDRGREGVSRNGNG